MTIFLSLFILLITSLISLAFLEFGVKKDHVLFSNLTYMPISSKFLAIFICLLLFLQCLILLLAIFFIADAHILSIIKICSKINLIMIGVIWEIFYLTLDSAFSTRLAKLYVIEFFLSLFLGIIISIIYVVCFNPQVNLSKLLIMLLILGFNIGTVSLVIAVYKVAQSYNVIAQATNDKLFYHSAMWMKIAAYTLPVIIGLIALCFSRVLFIIACIRRKETIS